MYWYIKVERENARSCFINNNSELICHIIYDEMYNDTNVCRSDTFRQITFWYPFFKLILITHA